MTMRTNFTPETISEMVKAYNICTALLGKTVRHEDVARHIIDTTAFGVEKTIEMVSMTMMYFKFRNKLMNGG